MKWRQLLCVAGCLLELAGCAAGSSTDTPSPTATATGATDSSSGTASTATTATMASTATGHTSSATPTSGTTEPHAELTGSNLPPVTSSLHFLQAGATAGPVATSPTSPELLGQLRTSPQPSPAPTSLPGSSPQPQGSSGVPTTRSPPTQPGDSADSSGSTAARSSSAATTERPPVPAATTAPHRAGDSPEPAPPAISCHRATGEGDTGAVCLQLNESSTCERFLEGKRSDLWQAICGNRTHTAASPCEIKLTPSSLDRDCLLLILKGEKDPDKLLNTLQKFPWEKFGIESLKKESARSQQASSQKTLIALVTSGLLLAFLGLAGYFLMKRRSWSPAGERLAEDPYYTETGSQGNTLLMTPSQEPAELQEKPNLPNINGGTQENGTGQAAAKNGHSGRQHSPADTEM